jgi:formyltetrahydrofolate deformylase
MIVDGDTATLLVSCRDQHGIVAALSGLLTASEANITASDQYSTDPEGGSFYLRMSFHLADLQAKRPLLEEDLARVGRQLGMTWRVSYGGQKKRVALFASRYDHCLLDLLWRWRRRELDCDLVCVISNHPDLKADVTAFGVPYHHVPISQESKAAAEAAILEQLDGADLIVLARYMQILSPEFLESVACPVINIHHSFLPAFVGPSPYRRAFERGVKLIGATAHYVTADLDEGPIIEQDVARVTHRDSAKQLAQIGRDIERVVLARAVQWHLADRVLVDANRTVVFV